MTHQPYILLEIVIFTCEYSYEQINRYINSSHEGLRVSEALQQKLLFLLSSDSLGGSQFRKPEPALFVLEKSVMFYLNVCHFLRWESLFVFSQLLSNFKDGKKNNVEQSMRWRKPDISLFCVSQYELRSTGSNKRGKRRRIRSWMWASVLWAAGTFWCCS